jgi:hypothetical protein
LCYLQLPFHFFLSCFPYQEKELTWMSCVTSNWYRSMLTFILGNNKKNSVHDLLLNLSFMPVNIERWHFQQKH